MLRVLLFTLHFEMIVQRKLGEGSFKRFKYTNKKKCNKKSNFHNESVEYMSN